MKKTLIYLFIACILLICFGLYAYNGVEQIKNLKLNNIDLSSISDGTYNGYFSYPALADRFTFSIEIIVQNHKIISIKTLNQNSIPENVLRKFSDNIIRTQSLYVDAISGASATSKAYLKAIENAFNK